MTMKKFAAAALLAFGATVAQATTVTIAGASIIQGDCTFACTSHYQQVYDNALFGTQLVDINSFNFISSGGTWGAGNKWAVRLSTVGTNAVDNLTSNFSTNLGSNSSVYATQSFSGNQVAGSLVTFSGDYIYNPLAGDLLIDIVALGTTSGPSLEFTYGSASPYSRVYGLNGSTTGYVGSDYGNVTQFRLGQANAVPEPASFALLGLGLAGVALSRRRKSTAGKPA